jgi:hypothetical protein
VSATLLCCGMPLATCSVSRPTTNLGLLLSPLCPECCSIARMNSWVVQILAGRRIRSRGMDLKSTILHRSCQSAGISRMHPSGTSFLASIRAVLLIPLLLLWNLKNPCISGVARSRILGASSMFCPFPSSGPDCIDDSGLRWTRYRINLLGVIQLAKIEH